MKKRRRASSLFRFKYPKLILLVISIFLAYYLFSQPAVFEKVAGLGEFGYFGIFFAGMLFSFGFSAPFAVGFFIALQPQNIFIAAFIGGSGALLSDLVIFRFIKASFSDEFEKLTNEKIIHKTAKLINENFGSRIKSYMLYFLAGIIIASPLPDEIGVTMLAGLTTIKQNVLAVISLILNSVGIFIILYLSL